MPTITATSIVKSVAAAVCVLSVIVDRAFANEKSRDRIVLQLLLWIVACFVLDSSVRPVADPTTESVLVDTAYVAWVHLVFAATLLHIVLLRPSRNRTSAGILPTSSVAHSGHPPSRRILSTSLNLFLSSWMPAFVRNVPPSACLAIVLSVTVAETAATPTFLLSLLLLLLLSSYCRQTGKPSPTDIPLSSNCDTNATPIPHDDPTRTVSSFWCLPAGPTRFRTLSTVVDDQPRHPTNESQWQSWSCHEVTTWLVISLQERHRRRNNRQQPSIPDSVAHEPTYFADYSSQLAIVQEQFSANRIQGTTLSHLQHPRVLARDIGIPYGTAVDVAECIHDLLQRHPIQSQHGYVVDSIEHARLDDRRRTTTTTTTAAAAAAAENDRANELMAGSVVSHRQSPPTSVASQELQHRTSDYVADLPEEQQQRLQSLMRSRYGLDLPPPRQMHRQNVTDTPRSSSPDGTDGIELARLRPQDLYQVIKQCPPNANSALAHEADVRTTVLDSVSSSLTPIGPIDEKDGSLATPGIPAEVLQQMPANIQQIAIRNPQLVRKLIHQRQGILNSTPQRPTPSRPQTVAEAAESDGDNNDPEAYGDPDETAALIHPRPTATSNQNTGVRNSGVSTTIRRKPLFH